jgi:3-oxoadipate enol-lactonase
MEQAQINGINIAYELAGAGTPMVMIHGAQGDQTMFAGLAATFRARFKVLTFDQRGSGLSDKPDMPYTMEMLADDAAALMDRLGIADAHIIGVSMGGMIAQEFALRHARRVRSLVLGCTTPGGPKSIRATGLATSAYSTREMSAEERGRALAEAAFSKGYIASHPEMISAMVELRRQRPIDPVGFARRMEALQTFDTYDRLPQIKCPTLVITGKDDALIPCENSRLIASRIAGARLRIIEPAGHCFWLEQPEESREAIEHFLGAPENVSV